MDGSAAFTVENFIDSWNGSFPNYLLTTPDLKNPHTVMGALFQVFERLSIDMEALIAPPPEETRNENTIYYWDLLPVINTTRVINHLVSVMPHVDTTYITHFLQPTVSISRSTLILLFNLMLFNEDRLRNIAPYEEELFSKTEQVKTLENRKNHLLEMLNEQAEEKGKRAERLEKMECDIKQFEEELKQEKEAYDEEKVELEAILKENQQTEIIIEQKKGQHDTLLSEIEKKNALRVHDADDIRAQAENAARNVQEAEEKLNALRNTLMQKENSLKNLQTIKPNLDIANNLLHEIIKHSEAIRDYENGDLDSDSKEGELDVLNTEVSELEAQLAELKAARAEASAKRQESHAKRQQEESLALSNLREAEEKEKKDREISIKAEQTIQEIKELTTKYEREKIEGYEELTKLKNNFINSIKQIEASLLMKVKESKMRIEDKLNNRSKFN
ncbi:unnamed protein product, partial [Brenthis ino]